MRFYNNHKVRRTSPYLEAAIAAARWHHNRAENRYHGTAPSQRTKEQESAAWYWFRICMNLLERLET